MHLGSILSSLLEEIFCKLSRDKFGRKPEAKVPKYHLNGTLEATNISQKVENLYRAPFADSLE